MRSLLLSALVALLTAFTVWQFAPAARQQGTVSESVYQRILRTGTLRCGYAIWEPAMTRDPNTGHLGGVLYDTIEKVASLLSLKVDWSHELNLSTYLEDMNAGKFDLECSGGFPNAFRGKFALYTQPLFFAPTYMYVPQDAPHKNFGDLDDPSVTISTMDGDYSQYHQQKYLPQAKTLTLPVGDFSQMLLNVVYGKADATVYDALSAEPVLKAHPGKLRRLEDKTVRVVPITLTAPRGEHDLTAMLNTAIQELVETDFINELNRKYSLPAGAILPVAKPYQNP